MADTLSPEERSRLMARIRSRDTKPEMYGRKAVWRAGFRYRLHSRTLPGKPDLALAQYKVAVLVHGCFWHQHGCAKTNRPSSNREFWDRKLDGNVARDGRNRAALRALGWTVLTVWECGLEEGTAKVLDVLKPLRAIRSPVRQSPRDDRGHSLRHAHLRPFGSGCRAQARPADPV